MKYRLLALCMALAVLLTGCRFLSDTYVSVTPHTDAYPQQAEEEALTVENYTELKNALLSLVEDGAEEAVLTTGAYSGNIEQDYDTAVAYITGINPMGAYIVSSIEKEIVRAGTYYKLNLRIRYRRSHAELNKAKTVRGEAGARDAVAAAVADSSERLLLRISGYEQIDFDAMVEECSQQDITKVMAQPAVTADVVPNSGSVRIVELNFSYPRPAAELRVMQSAVNTIMNSAYGYVRFGQNDVEKAVLLYSFLTERHDYIVQSSETPAYALLCEGVADSRAFAEVYSIMCNRANVNCTIVHGKKDGKAYDWNILELESGTWHIDVLGDEQAGSREPNMRTDEQMEGYSWDRQAYPECGGLIAPPEPPEGPQEIGKPKGETTEPEQQNETPAPEEPAEMPEQPEAPSEPEAPETPAEPSEPEKPDEPEEPEAPEMPVEPEEPELPPAEKLPEP